MGSVFDRGQRLFLASAGVVTLSALAGRDGKGKPGPLREGEVPAFYVLHGLERVACVPIAEAEKTLRPLVTRSVAEQMLALLRDPVAPPAPSTRPLLERGRDAVHQGSPLEQVTVLRELCQLPAPLSEALGSGLRFLRDLVLGEISEVLGRAKSELEEELRARFPAVDELESRGAQTVRFTEK